MLIEHYPGMTERALTKIAEEACARWSLGDVLVIHRYGQMAPGDQIMMVATASPHRKDAFAAADFLMDYLKSRAPFWKKEVTADGSDWVAAKDEDEEALRQWQQGS
jgi:molybdopterin synthase catalytic subunit